MRHTIAPIACKPWGLNGLSERLVTSHYENDYGAAVRDLNGIREALGALDFASAPGHQIRALKTEELAAMGAVALHELYFETLGGDGAAVFTGTGRGGQIAEPVSAALERNFGSVASWRHEFVALAHAIAGGSGWVLLNYSRRDGRLYNQLAVNHAYGMLDAVPLLALDMYEHAYHIDFGANASAYVDAFMRNISWAAVGDRLTAALSGGPATPQSGDDQRGSISVEELAAMRSTSGEIRVLDVRPKHYFSRSTEMMHGAAWRDPDRIDEWSKALSAGETVVVYCAYGYAVGCGVADTLRERGVDAKFVRGGFSAWNAAGGERTLRPRDHA